MLKYGYSQIYTKEVPEHISLGISFTGCPIRCPECHSKRLWEDKGIDLTFPELMKIFYPNNRLISCILFYGGEWNWDYLIYLINSVKKKGFTQKIALYSGHDLSWFQTLMPSSTKLLDYLKVGPYTSEYGPLNNPNTNQRMYKLEDGKIIEDITYKFWR